MVEIAPQSVDFAVVGEIAERVREVPGWEGVGAVPLMDQRQRRPEQLVAEVGIKFFQLSGQQQPFVDDAARGHAADVTLRQGFFDQTAHHEKFALKRGGRGKRLTTDEELADQRRAFARGAADLLGMNRNIAPGDHPPALVADDLLNLRLAAGAAEDHRHTVAPGFRQSVPHFTTEKFMRKRQQQPGAVTGIRISARRPTVHQPLEHGQPHLHNAVTRPVVEIRHQADTTCVMLVGKAVEAAVRHRRRSEPPLLILLSILFHSSRAPSCF